MRHPIHAKAEGKTNETPAPAATVSVILKLKSPKASRRPTGSLGKWKWTLLLMKLRANLSRAQSNEKCPLVITMDAHSFRITVMIHWLCFVRRTTDATTGSWNFANACFATAIIVKFNESLAVTYIGVGHGHGSPTNISILAGVNGTCEQAHSRHPASPPGDNPLRPLWCEAALAVGGIRNVAFGLPAPFTVRLRRAKGQRATNASSLSEYVRATRKLFRWG
jgi:hypothetical protein